MRPVWAQRRRRPNSSSAARPGGLRNGRGLHACVSCSSSTAPTSFRSEVSSPQRPWRPLTAVWCAIFPQGSHGRRIKWRPQMTLLSARGRGGRACIVPWHGRAAPNRRQLAPRPLRASAWHAGSAYPAAIFHIIRFAFGSVSASDVARLRCGSRSCVGQIFLLRWRSRHRCASSSHASCEGRNAT